MEPLDNLITLAEAAQRLGVTPRQISRMVNGRTRPSERKGSGRKAQLYSPPVLRVVKEEGRRRYVRAADVQALIDARSTPEA